MLLRFITYLLLQSVEEKFRTAEAFAILSNVTLAIPGDSPRYVAVLTEFSTTNASSSQLLLCRVLNVRVLAS